MMNNTYSEEGSTSIQVLVFLFSFSILIFSTAYITMIIKKQIVSEQKELEQKEEINTLFDEILMSFSSGTSPESDSKFDEIWDWNNKTVSGITVTIEPVSDKLNPNFIRKNLITKTKIQELFLDGKTADELQQYREDEGFQYTAQGYKDFFSEENYNTYFSCYGWANINLIDEFSFRKLVLHRTNSQTASESMHSRIQKLLAEGTVLSSYTDFNTFLGIYEKELYPYVTLAPQYNIHFIDPFLLQEILQYPDYELKDADKKYTELIQLRDQNEISLEELHNILEIDKDNRQYYYLGTQTWFWKITLQSGSLSFDCIVCKYPPDNDLEMYTAIFSVIEKRFYK